jgi:hypothetical protein
MSDSELRAIGTRRDRLATRAIRAIASAVFAATLTAAFHPGPSGAQTPEAEPAESEAVSSEEMADDSAEATPTAATKPSKKISKPFEPTERIEAESVVSFPTNI